MRNVRNLFVGMLISGVGMVGLLSGGRAEARKGGLPQCLKELATCQTDLDACEAAPSAVFPGDGVTGPALSYMDNGDGTITDNNTHLIWEKKDTVAGSVHNVGNTYSWSSSGTAADGSLFTTFLATLNTVPCFADHCDWRIPNVKELQSIMDYSKPFPDPTIASTFPGPTATWFYWSSTSNAYDPGFAWGGVFFYGSVQVITKDINYGAEHARAVRGGLLSVGMAEAGSYDWARKARKGGLPQCLKKLATCQTDLDACEAAPSAVFPGDGVTGPALSYTDNGDGTITDNNTQLVWEKKDTVAGSVHNVQNIYQWSSSGSAADGSLFTTFLAMLNTDPCFAGHCDWRIPNVKELQSIMDYSKPFPGPAIASTFPGPTATTGYWSSTSFASDPFIPWVGDFSGGSVVPLGDGKRFPMQARAVRGGS